MKKALLKLTLLMGVNATLLASSTDYFASQQNNDTIYVNQASSGNDNGQTWADAYLDLQDAISNANAGDQIWVAKGKYLPTTTINRDVYFTIKEEVDILGGFAGTEKVSENRDFITNETILSGNIGSASSNTNNSKHVVYVKSINTAILDGFTVQDGYCRTGKFSSNETNTGGGIYFSNSNITLKNLILKDNEAEYGGGIAITSASAPLLENITTTSNYGRWGAGMYINNTPSTTNLLTAKNIKVTKNRGLSGVGMYIADSRKYTFSNIQVYDNNGTGVRVYRGNSGSFENLSIYNNTGVGIEVHATSGVLSTDLVTFKNLLVYGHRTNFDSFTRDNSLKFEIYNATIVGKADMRGQGSDRIKIQNSIITGPLTCEEIASATISYSLAPSGIVTDGGNNQFDVSAQFTDSTNSDFRITGNSPARDNALNSVTLPELDVLGNARIENGKLDIGALEYHVTLGLYENKIQNTLVAFPNPFENNFVVNANQNSSISVYTNEGVLVQDIQDVSGQVSINASDFTSGLYHIVIVNSEGKQYATIMKK